MPKVNTFEKISPEIQNDKIPIISRRFHVKVYREVDFSEDEMLMC
jgi:hypothetical protein